MAAGYLVDCRTLYSVVNANKHPLTYKSWSFGFLFVSRKLALDNVRSLKCERLPSRWIPKMRFDKFSFLVFCGLLCCFESVFAGRSLSFNFHLPGLRLNDGPPPEVKTYDGSRLRDDSIIMVYYHDLSVAVVELGPKKLLLNCNIIEI